MIFQADCSPTPDNQEYLGNKKNEYPYICQYADVYDYPNHMTPWHWHAAFEVSLVTEGEALVRTTDRVFTVAKGQLIFINQGVMHTFSAAARPCGVYSHIFDASFLAGLPGGLLERRYIMPVLMSEQMSAVHIVPDHRETIALTDRIMELTQVVETEPEGFELMTLETLSAWWRLFYMETRGLHEMRPSSENQDMERMKRMIRFIYDHYEEPISLKDIAGAADISVREADRCFERNLHLPPKQFLTRHRLNAACEMLRQTDRPVLEVAEACGFSSGSYFSKVFTAAEGCTPGAYRRKKEQDNGKERPAD